MSSITPMHCTLRHAYRLAAAFCLLIGLATSAFSAIAFDATSSAAATGNGQSLSWSHTVGAGTNMMLVVGVAAEDTNTNDLVVSSVTCGGVAMTAVPNSIASNGTSTINRSQLFYLANPGSGAKTIVVSYVGNVGGIAAGATSLSGVAAQAPEAVATNNVGSGSVLSTNISTLTAGAWVVDVIGSGATTVNFTATTSGMTERWDRQSNGCGGAGSTKAPAATGATTMSWTASTGGRLVQSVAAFAAAGGGGGPGPWTLTTTTSGSGSISRNPNASTYADGTVVALTATPVAGWNFTGWSGDLTGSTNPQNLTMNANKNVTATFSQTPPTNYTLTVTTSGSGSVSLNPAGGSYASGTVVTLTATPNSGYQFSGWSVDLTGSTNPAQLTMNSNKNVTATFTTVPVGNDLYVAPNGVAGAAGTISAPTTLPDAITRITNGNTIWVRGGTYNYSVGIAVAIGNNGASGALKKIWAYNGEVPVYNFSGQALADANRGLTLNGHFWHVKGLTVEWAGDNGIYVGGNNNIVELCLTRFNRDSGVQISRASSSYTQISQWPTNNLILNCTSHDNKDATSENADGFACKLTSGNGNVFRGCIAHHNADDGWDLFTKSDTGPIGPVLIENCVAYNNGTLSDGTSSPNGDKNGFKLGGTGIAVAHTIRRSIAFNNGHHGITDNNNPGPIQVVNNTSFGNVNCGFNFRQGGNHVFTNNASLNAGSSDVTYGTQTGFTNLWWKNAASNNNGGPLVISASDFQSLTPTLPFGRNADGSINLGTFCKLAAGSDLINNGSPSGTDIGAIESF